MTAQRRVRVPVHVVPFILLLLGTLAGRTTATWAAWSASTTVSVPHDAIEPIVLASGPAGDLVYWHFDDLLSPAREIFGQAGARFATMAPGGASRPGRSLDTAYASGPLVNLGEGPVAQLILRGTPARSSQPEVVLGSVSGVFGAPMRVPAAAVNVSLAGNSRGELLLAWITTLPSGRRRVWASLRPAGHTFGKPELLSSSADARQVTAAIDTSGFAADMLVAFASRQGRMLVRVRYHHRGWGAVQDAGPAAIGTSNEISVNIGRNGRVVLAWSHQQLSEGGPLGPGCVTVAVRPANAHGFLPAQALERDPNASIDNRPVLVNDAGRGLALAFIAQPGIPVAGFTPTVLRVSYSHANTFAAPQTLSPAGQQVSDLAGAEGPLNDILTWSGGPYPSMSALGPAPAIYAASGGTTVNRLGPAMQASPEEQAEASTPVYSVAAGGWLLAWRAHPSFRSLINRGQPVVRIARCSGTCS